MRKNTKFMMDLNTAFCLIKGYVDTYFNQPLKITIKEIEQCEGGDR